MKRNDKKFIAELRGRIVDYYGKRLVSLIMCGSFAQGVAKIFSATVKD